MRILFERSGGFMGRTISLDLDLEQLPDEEAASLRYMLQQSNFYNLTSLTSLRVARDDFQYLITVEEGTSQHTVRVSDENAPAELRPLLQELSKLARSPKS